MSNTKLNCCKCGKEFELTERIYTSGDLWQCEDCAIKQMQENDNKDKIIADLEAKLAENEEKYNNLWHWSFQELQSTQQQLAEKEKEIEIKTETLLEKDKELEYYKSWFADDDYKKHNQDKISFAVEQLEKVKEKLLEELDNVTELLDPLEYEDYHEFIGCGRGYKNSIEEIDNQIKQLKEME